MSASSFISRRYFAGQKRMFVSFLSIIAIIGVALGVFSLVVVLSVMLGFNRDLEQKLMGFNAHVMVESSNKGLEFPSIIGTLGKNISSNMVTIEGEGIVDVKEGPVQGVKIRGMDEGDFNVLSSKGIEFYSGKLDYKKANERAILGSELAYQLGVHPDFGDNITLVAPIGRVGPTGELIPERMTFDVAGMFKSGYFEHDSKVVIIPKDSAARLLGTQSRTVLHIWLSNSHKAGITAKMIRESYPDVHVFTWEEANKKLFSALKLERIAMAGLLILIIIIACISIISVTFMYVFARRKDIAILSAMGSTKGLIRSIFINVGVYIGLSGTIVGLISGIVVCLFLAHKQIRLPASYYLDHLPVVISWPFLIMVGIFGMTIAVCAAVYPARHAARLDPMEVLRYE